MLSPEISSINNSKKHSNKASLSFSKKILIIDYNKTDRFLIKKILSEDAKYIFLEAEGINNAIELSLEKAPDIIIINDVLPTMNGHKAIKKLNHYEVLRKIPKLLLQTKTAAAKELKFTSGNFDSIAKPLNHDELQTRVHFLLHKYKSNQEIDFGVNKLFNTKIDKFKEFGILFKSVMDFDDNILFLYDIKSKKVIDANKQFYSFFGNLITFNKIISNEKILKRFIPAILQENFLNFYNHDDWINILTLNDNFEYMIILFNNKEEYVFNVKVDFVKLSDKNILLVKLTKTLSKMSVELKKSKQNIMIDHNELVSKSLYFIDQDIDHIKKNIEFLEENSTTKKLTSLTNNIQKTLKKVFLMIDKKESKNEKPILSDDINIFKSVIEVLNDMHKVNSNMTTIYVNNKRFSNDIDENAQDYYIKSSEIKIKSIFKAVFNNFCTEPFDVNKAECNKNMDIQIYKDQNNINIKIEIIEKQNDGYSFLKGIFKSNNSEKNRTDMLPKELEKNLEAVHGEIKTIFEKEKSIFLIILPK